MSKVKHHQLTLVSWNINGARAVYRKGFMDWLAQAQPDVLGLQETRAEANELPSDLAQPEGYTGYWNPAREKRGYSGTALLTKSKPLAVEYGLGIERFDGEGRTLIG
jgi:exodeoxyribonuclease-3